MATLSGLRRTEHVKAAIPYLAMAVALVVGMWSTSLIGLWGFDPDGRPSDGCVFWVWYEDDCPLRHVQP